MRCSRVSILTGIKWRTLCCAQDYHESFILVSTSFHHFFTCHCSIKVSSVFLFGYLDNHYLCCHPCYDVADESFYKMKCETHRERMGLFLSVSIEVCCECVAFHTNKTNNSDHKLEPFPSATSSEKMRLWVESLKRLRNAVSHPKAEVLYNKEIKKFFETHKLDFFG